MRALIALALASASPFAVADDQLDVDLTGGRLHDALVEFAEEHQISIFFAEETVADMTVAPVKGQFSVAEALSALLEGHCLRYAFVRDSFIAITPGCDSAIAGRTDPAAAVAPAQPDAPAPQPDYVEEVFVRAPYITGSRLRNPAFGETMPLDVIDATEIRLSGFQSVGELLRYVPAVAGNSTSTLISNGGDGSATVTLRGLPASNTLVLLNGRRMNPDALSGSAVDLNSLPLAMVERIEILKDGVSAIYGSDAVAGVVNVITKQPQDGLQISMYHGTSDENDLQTERFSLAFGGSGERWQASVGVDYYDQQGIDSADRRVSASADDRARGGIDKRSSATAPARITVGDTAVILREGLSGDQISDFRPATDDDLFEFRDFTSAVVPSRRITTFAQGQLALNPGLAQLRRGHVQHDRSNGPPCPGAAFFRLRIRAHHSGSRPVIQSVRPGNRRHSAPLHRNVGAPAGQRD